MSEEDVQSNREGITVKQAAEILKVKAPIVRAYCENGDLDARKVSSDRKPDFWMIDANSVAAFKDQREQDQLEAERAAYTTEYTGSSDLPTQDDVLVSKIRQEILDAWLADVEQRISRKLLSKVSDPNVRNEIMEQLEEMVQETAELALQMVRVEEKNRNLVHALLCTQDAPYALEIIRLREKNELLDEQLQKMRKECKKLLKAKRQNREPKKSWWERMIGK